MGGERGKREEDWENPDAEAEPLGGDGMTDAPGKSESESDSLSVQVAGGRGEPEKLFVLTRPRAGVVDVREFRFGCDQAAPLEYAAATDDLLAGFERAHGQRRRLSEDLYRIRLWLDG